MRKFLLSLSLVALCPMIHGFKAPFSSPSLEGYASRSDENNKKDLESQGDAFFQKNKKNTDHRIEHMQHEERPNDPYGLNATYDLEPQDKVEKSEDEILNHKFTDVYAAETIKDNPRDSKKVLQYEIDHNQSLDAKAIDGKKNHEKEVLSHEKQEKNIIENEHQKYENHRQKLENTTYGHGETDHYAGGETGESYEGSTDSYGDTNKPSTDLHNKHHKKSHHSSRVEKKAKKKSKADFSKKHSNHEITDLYGTQY